MSRQSAGLRPSPSRGRSFDWMPLRTFVLTLGAGLSLMLMAGCPRGDSPSDAQNARPRFAGTDVRVVLPAELDLVAAWTPGFEDWAAETDATYSISEIRFADSGTGETDWLAALQAAEPTLVLLPTPLVNRLTADGLTAPIPEGTLASDTLDWNRLAIPVRQALGMVGNRPAVYPVTCSSLVVYCRTDLLEAAGRQVPQSWDEYDELVKTVDQWAPGLSAIEPRGVESLATLFLARTASSAKPPTQYSFELDVSTGDPLISSPAFLRTWEKMSELTSSLSDASNAASFDDCHKAFFCGQAAIAISTLSTDTAADCDPPLSSEAKFPYVTASLPGSRSVFNRDAGKWETLEGSEINRPALCGFDGLAACVMADAEDVEQQAAWNLWARLMRLQESAIIPPLPGVPCRSSAPGASILDARASTVAAGPVSLEQAITPEDRRLVAELPCIGRDRLLAALNDALRTSLENGAPADEALNKAADAWTNIIEEIGRPQVLNSYRQRLGLTALP